MGPVCHREFLEWAPWQWWMGAQRGMLLDFVSYMVVLKLGSTGGVSCKGRWGVEHVCATKPQSGLIPGSRGVLGLLERYWKCPPAGCPAVTMGGRNPTCIYVLYRTDGHWTGRSYIYCLCSPIIFIIVTQFSCMHTECYKLNKLHNPSSMTSVIFHKDEIQVQVHVLTVSQLHVLYMSITLIFFKILPVDMCGCYTHV